MIISSHSKSINVHTLLLADPEIESILDDPEWFLDRLRLLLNHTAARPVVKPQTKKKERKPYTRKTGQTLVKCEWCGREMAPQGMGRHKRACPQRPA